MACLIVGARRAVPLRSHLEHAFHALLAVAFEEEQLLVAVDREGAWHRRSERDLHRCPARISSLIARPDLGSSMTKLCGTSTVTLLTVNSTGLPACTTRWRGLNS